MTSLDVIIIQIEKIKKKIYSKKYLIKMLEITVILRHSTLS